MQRLILERKKNVHAYKLVLIYCWLIDGRRSWFKSVVKYAYNYFLQKVY